MGKRRVSILQPASSAVAEIAFFIESKGMPQTAKKFVDEVFEYFHRLSDKRIIHKPCRYLPWQHLNYRCVPFKKKYIVAYLDLKYEIVICEFVPAKLIH